MIDTLSIVIVKTVVQITKYKRKKMNNERTNFSFRSTNRDW